MSKKVLKSALASYLVLVVFVTTLQVPTFASYSDAEICTQIGMIRGTGKGVTDDYLESIPLRYQAAVLYLRLTGYEDKMNVFNSGGKANFNDAKGQSNYTTRLMAYLKAHPEHGWIGDDFGNFLPQESISVQAYTKVMLEALGYEYNKDYTWNKVFSFAKSVGLDNYSKEPRSFTIEDLCGITVDALKAETKAGEILAQKLVDDNKISKTKAVETGLIEDVPEIVFDAEIEAISKKVLKIKFNQPVDDFNSSNISVKMDTVNKSIGLVTPNLDNTEATVKVNWLDYNKDIVVTLKGIRINGKLMSNVSKTVHIDSLHNLYEVNLTSGDSDDTIKADGSTSTSVTAQLIRKADNQIVKLNAIVVFTATKGALSKTEVTMENGQASVQLTSMSSTKEITSYIYATIVNAPSDTEYEGLKGKLEIKFSPNETRDENQSLLNIISASAFQGDRMEITFSGNLEAKEYKDELMKMADADSWSEIAGTNEATLTLNDQPVPIVDVLQISANKLEFILYTDSEGSDKPYTSAIETGFLGSATNYIVEKTPQILTMPTNVGNLVNANMAGVVFTMYDVTTPYLLGVENANQVSFGIKFSEPIAEDNIETARGSVNEHLVIDSKKVYLTLSPNGANRQEIDLAKKQKYILVNEVYVGAYDTKTGDETRNMVYVQIDREHALNGYSHTIIVDGISDWAGLTDKDNVMLKRTFNFTIEIDQLRPTVSIEKQSIEQFKLMFSEKIYFDDSSANSIKFYRGDDMDVPLVQDSRGQLNPEIYDYSITDITSENDEGTVLLIEMLKDWTEYYDSLDTKEKYYDSKYNPYTIQIVSNQIRDIVGNYMLETWTDLGIYNDYIPPTIVNVYDVATQEVNIEAGNEIRIEVDEPIQVLARDGSYSTVPLTPSQMQTIIAKGKQYNSDNVTKAEFAFTRGNKVVQGAIIPGSISQDDMAFSVEPVEVLTQGSWTLTVKYLTDDAGNMFETDTFEVYAASNDSINTGTKVVWAAFDNSYSTTSSNKDYLYIKFSKVMNELQANGVARTTNYFINGVALPDGSSVQAGIEGVTTEWDGVTIVMPAGVYQTGSEDDNSLIVNIANTIRSKEGELLATPHEFELLDTSTSGGNYLEKDGLGEMGTNRLDAVYTSDDGYGTLEGMNGDEAIVIYAKARDNNMSGGIDLINVVLSKAITVQGTEKILLGGKEFTNISKGLQSSLTFTRDEDDLEKTSTEDLVLTTEDGSIVIQKKSVVDLAQPVIISAQPVAGTNKVTITFSEKVQHTGGGALTVHDIIYTNGNGSYGEGPILDIKAIDDTSYQITLSASTSVLDINNDSVIPIAGNITDLKGNIVYQTGYRLQ